MDDGEAGGGDGLTSARARVGLLVAAMLAVFALRIAVEGSSQIGIGYLYVVPCAFAALWFGRRAGFVVAAASTLLYVASVVIVDDFRPASAILRVAAMIGAVVLAAEFRARTIALADTQLELDAVRQALTPANLPQLQDIDLAVDFLPARHGVSGDFYLVTNGPGTTNTAIVADICGHGPRSAALAAFARATMASVAASCADPAELLTLVNATLVERWEGEDYLTATCVVHDPTSETLRWATAGHPAPLLLPQMTELPLRGVPLGLFPDATYETQSTAFVPPIGVLLYTDGLIDAGNGTERFGEARLRETLGQHVGAPAKEVADALRNAVHDFAGRRLPDDVCILVLRATST